MKGFRAFSLLASAALALMASGAQAAYPERPITMVVAYDAGGGTDVTARMLAPFIEKYLGDGAKIEVVNKPGAGGEIGFAMIADSAADGYTIGFINTPNVITIPIERQARFTFDKLDPLVNIVDDPSVMSVHAETEFKTLADLVSFAQANPGGITVGSTGVGSDDHLAMLLLQRLSKATFTHVPFPGSGAASKALVGQKIKVLNHNLGEAVRLRSAESVRLLGVMSDKRWNEAADTPTFREQGYDIVMNSLRGVGAPKGLPADVRAKLVDSITKAVNDPEFQAKAAAPETFQPLRVLGPDAYAAEMAVNEKQFRTLWQESPWLK